MECFAGWLEIPPTPGLKVCGFGHGERCREAREKVAVVLAIGHTFRAHEALSRPDALPGFLEDSNKRIPQNSFAYLEVYAIGNVPSYPQARCPARHRALRTSQGELALL